MEYPGYGVCRWIRLGDMTSPLYLLAVFYVNRFDISICMLTVAIQVNALAPETVGVGNLFEYAQAI